MSIFHDLTGLTGINGFRLNRRDSQENFFRKNSRSHHSYDFVISFKNGNFWLKNKILKILGIEPSYSLILLTRITAVLKSITKNTASHQ